MKLIYFCRQEYIRLHGREFDHLGFVHCLVSMNTQNCSVYYR
jgi:hypothetical protein